MKFKKARECLTRARLTRVIQKSHFHQNTATHTHLRARKCARTHANTRTHTHTHTHTHSLALYLLNALAHAYSNNKLFLLPIFLSLSFLLFVLRSPSLGDSSTDLRSKRGFVFVHTCTCALARAGVQPHAPRDGVRLSGIFFWLWEQRVSYSWSLWQFLPGSGHQKS